MQRNFGKGKGLMSKQLETIKKIGEDIGITDLLEKIMQAGEKRTAILDESGYQSKQVKKTEEGVEYPARCYAYVPDAEQVSTWKLQLCNEDLEITREQLGHAAAAFSEGGFRGERVDLPRDEVGKVKRRIRSEYEKLGVERENMPEGIKEMDAEKIDVDEKEDKELASILRELAEAIAQIDDDDMREPMAAMISDAQKLLMQYEEEEMSEEEVVDTEQEKMEGSEQEKMEHGSEKEDMTKEDYVKEFAEAIDLNGLEKLLEDQTKAIQHNSDGLKALGDLTKAVEVLVEKHKNLFERIEDLEEKSVEVEEQTKRLSKSDEEKLAEKQLRFTPNWGSYRASSAAETVVSDEDAKKYDKPKVASAITGISNRIYGGK